MVGMDQAVPSPRSREAKWLFLNPFGLNNKIMCFRSIQTGGMALYRKNSTFISRYTFGLFTSSNFVTNVYAGRAAMVGFFMAYFVDSLTGVGLVDQMGNFFCKTLLFVAVAGVLLVRKNEDIDNLKKLIDESTFYDKQWQSTWQDDSPSGPKK
uniref:Uncharacterized protein n=1 Tax=Aegilops tauschii subsp. strangulata TaxID=200361 RepID=A0A453N3J0_AEGTS